MANRLLVVAAHPDDEVLGVGGSIAAHTANGDEVHILVLGEGQTSREESPGDRQAIAELQIAARQAASHLGAEISFCGLPDNAFDSVPLLDVIRPIERSIATIQPEVIYTHHVGDLNIDHQRTCRAVLTASRPVGGFVPDVLSFEVRSSTDWADGLGTAPAFQPNIWNVLTPSQCRAKLAALRFYHQEMRPWPHSRSLEAIEALWRHRGAQVGAEAAEALVMLRSIRRRQNPPTSA